MTKFSRDDFKISFLNEHYFVDEKQGTVTCKMKYHVLAPEGNFTWLNESRSVTYMTTGIARCNSTDAFDVTIGKKIARTKAENKAYVQVKRGIQRIIDEYSHIILLCGCFKEKADKVISHNSDYLDKVESSVKLKKVETPTQPVAKKEDKTALGTNKNVKTYTKHTPIGDITFTEKHLTNDEAKKMVNDFEDRFNKMLDDFSKNFPKFF